MSISSISGFNPFGILSSFAEPDTTASDSAASSDAAGASGSEATTATSTPTATPPTPQQTYQSLLEAVTQLGGGLTMTTGNIAAATGNSDSATGNDGTASATDNNSPKAMQARLHELFQKLANATAEGGPGLSRSGQAGQRVAGGHGHHHHRHHEVASSDASADTASGAADAGAEVANQDPAALLHQVVATLGQLSDATGGAATTSAQTGASYDIMAQLQTTGGLVNLKAD